MLLFALVGIDCVVHRRGYNLIGWVLIGASGWIKNEGLLILIASWIGVRVVYGRKPATLKALLLAGLIPVCWHVAVRVCGAKLFDYANPWQVDWTRGIKAFLYTLNYFFLSPWESGFVAYLFCFLLAMGLLRLRKLRKRKEMCFTALVSGISMFLYFYVFSVIFISSQLQSLPSVSQPCYHKINEKENDEEIPPPAAPHSNVFPTSHTHLMW